MNWNRDFTKLNSHEDVLLLCRWEGGKPFILIGNFTPGGFDEFDDYCQDDGFYEYANGDGEHDFVRIESNILAWQPLPPTEIEE